MPVVLDLHKGNPIVDETFKIYDVEVNDVSLSFDCKSTVEFDSDGDVRVKLKVDVISLLDSIEQDSIIDYLDFMGYSVTKQD